MMVIISKSILNKYGEGYPESKEALLNWYLKVKNGNWSNFHELKKSFNSIDAVGNNRYVFNIKGNSYRLIALISFNAQKVYIRFIGTHAAYDRIKDIKTI